MSPFRSPRKPAVTLKHDVKILLLVLAGGLLAVVSSLVLVWMGSYSGVLQWTVSLLVVGSWLAFAFGVQATVVHPLQLLANRIAVLREGDYSSRFRGANSVDALGQVMMEVNTLAELLHQQRLGAMEAGALLSTIMSEIDVAIFAFNSQHRLRLVNRAGERLLAQPSERLLGRRADELGLQECLDRESARTFEQTFPGGTGRWGMRRTTFRQSGVPHDLIVLADLSRALREEERQAWQRLVRVLGHELNNSLAPICSISSSLKNMFAMKVRLPDWEDDLRSGLRVIADRSEALSRFMNDYARLTRLPQPRPRPFDVEALIREIIALDPRVPVEFVLGPVVRAEGDPDQIQQLMINLVRNAIDASLETHGKIRVGWECKGRILELFVEDEGPGVANLSNLFVPFFTTKKTGSGVGLVVSRQIAEAHGGTIRLENRPDHKGCIARVELPITFG
jgi:two-component system, NtrC family, nitrogen regulation sensor histidine kinase NtrY